jgi:hypothetical protein
VNYNAMKTARNMSASNDEFKLTGSK